MVPHEEIYQQKKLPRVGETVRSKKYGTLWKVIEKREMWSPSADDPITGNLRLVPAVYLCFWKIEEGQVPGLGQMLGFAYTLHDNTFETNWEVVS